MKSIYYVLGALTVAGSAWFISNSLQVDTAVNSKNTSSKAPNKTVSTAAQEYTAIPKMEPHSCEGCDHDSHQDHAVTQLIANKKNQSWPAVVIKHLEKHYQVSEKAIRHLSRAVSYTEFEQLTEEELARVVRYSAAVQGKTLPELIHLCWEGSTPVAFREAMDSVRSLAVLEEIEQEPQAVFQGIDRWTRTATDGTGISVGTPITITWGLVPDGTTVAGTNSFPDDSPSNLIATLNSTYGASTTGNLQDAPWFELFETAFEYWSEVTGNIYIYEPNDDGVDLNGFSSSGFRGTLGVRPDVRIGGTTLDGNSGTLAFNYFPNSGNMVFDTADSSNFTNSNNTRILFRNVVAHEHGHGLGFSHVCPINRTKLMEPIATRSFIGVQFDDMITAQGIYGDPRERSGGNSNNDSTGNASDFGTIADNFESEQLSISSANDTDFYKFNVGLGKRLTLRLVPTTEAVYLEGEQLTTGCTAGTNFDPNTRQKLSVRVLDTNGTTVLATADSQPIGSEETITNLGLPQPGQDYFIEVTGGGENSSDNNNAQVYTLILVVEDASSLVGSNYTLTQEACSPANQAADPDEVVTAQITVTNTGITAINSPQVSIRGSSNLTVVGSNSLTLPNLPANTSTTATFQFAVSGECGAEEILTFTVTGGTEDFIFNQTINLGALVNAIDEDFESSISLPSSLTASSTNPASLWEVNTTSPINGANSVFTAGSNSTTSDLTTGSILSRGTDSVLTFQHLYDFENNFDGGTLEISINGGIWQEWIAAGGTFTANGYNGTASGVDSWTGNSGQALTTTAVLPASTAGQNVSIRWRATYDFTVISTGWRIDDITLSGIECCSVSTPIISVITSDDFAQENDVSDEGEFTVSSSTLSASDLSIAYTLGGTATSGSDFLGLAGTATINAGQQSVTIPVTAIRDSIIEGDETITLTASPSMDYTLGTNTASLTILDLPFDQWRHTFFGTNTANIGDADDFDFDGVQNLIEYALGQDPTVSNSQQPLAVLQSDVNQLVLTYEEDTTLTDIQYIVEASPTLGISPNLWSTEGITLSPGAIVDGKRTVTASTPANVARQFMRLRVVRN